MDILKHNSTAWDNEVINGNQWTVPASEQDINEARNGNLRLHLTPYKRIPDDWLGNVSGKKVLCLASGGGQQGPILASAEADVTVFDNSEYQLKQDKKTAKVYNLHINTIKGNMQDLSVFCDSCFDLIIHPVSNVFIDDIRPVWKEAYRVLKHGGRLLSGLCNPIIYMFDWRTAEEINRYELKYSIPYSDLVSLTEKEKKEFIEKKTPFEFGHSLTDQIAGQLDAGFVISGFYEDKGDDLLDRFIDPYIATRAEKLIE